MCIRRLYSRDCARTVIRAAVVMIVLPFIAIPGAHAQFTFVNVADTTTAAPSGGTFNTFGNPSLNNPGTAAFIATTNAQPAAGVFVGGTGGLQAVATTFTTTAIGGTYSQFSGEPFINGAGVVAMQANSGLFTGTAGPGPQGVLAISTQAAPTPPGGTLSFPAIALSTVLNSSNTSAYFATVIGGSSSGGIFRSTATAGPSVGPATKIALNGETAPGTGGGTFSSISTSPGINDSGVVSFFSNVTGGVGGAGIFTGDGISVSAVAVMGGAAPSGGTYNGFTSQASPRINGSGRVIFEAQTSASANGLFAVGPGPGTAIIALSGGVAPGGGTFNVFDAPNINAGGTASFIASVLGAPTSTFGIFTGGPGGTQKVVRQGDTLFGSTVTGLNVSVFSTGLNDFGQVAFAYTLASGKSGVAIASPVGAAAAAPEPVSLALLVFGGLPLAAGALRHRGRFFRH